MDQQESEYFKWLLRKCKVNLNTEQHKQLIEEIDVTLKKLLGTYGDEIHRYQEEPEQTTGEQNGNNDSTDSANTINNAD